MINEAIVSSWLTMLRSWQKLGAFQAQHILSCPICTLAELSGGKGYCAIGDEAWSEMMRQELRVIGIVPELRAAGIDVDKDLAECGCALKFMAERAAK